MFTEMPLIKSLYWFSLVACLTLFVTGCSQIAEPPAEIETNTSPGEKDIKAPKQIADDMKWLGYADPKADAYLAIEKDDFRILAFAGRSVSFPGIEVTDQEALKQQCDYRFLANSGDTLSSQKELDVRKQLFQYASKYNLIFWNACKSQ